MARFRKFKRRRGDGPKVLDLPRGNGKKRERVFVGIPVVGDDVSLVIWNFVHALHQMNQDPECPFEFFVCIEKDKRPVYYARNCMVGRFLESDCDKLWFVDCDMVPEPSAFQILHVDADIVAARMYSIKRKPDQSPHLELCAFVFDPAGDKSFHSVVPSPNAPAVHDVDGVGTGCTVFKRRVLEDRRLWGDTRYEWQGKTADVMEERDDDGTAAPPVFRWIEKPNGKPLRGEDLDLSKRAKDLGYSIKVHFAATCGHIKSMNLDDSLRIVDKILDNMRSEAERRKKEGEACESAG